MEQLGIKKETQKSKPNPINENKLSQKVKPIFVSVNSLLVDEIVYDLLADFGYSNTDRKVLYCVYGFHFLT